MVTKEQAMTETRFHYTAGCEVRQTSRGNQHEVWRKNGQTKTWKTRPGEFRVPVKFGLRNYSGINHLNAAEFTVESECPFNHGEDKA